VKKFKSYKLLAAFTTICFLGLLFFLMLGPACKSKGERSITGPIKLRSDYKTLTEEDVISMLNKNGFFDKRWNRRESFPNKFELKTINGDQVLIDHATGLVWHQSGSSTPLSFENAIEWLTDLNRRQYAGFSTWRFPTLEEAASILEKKTYKLYHVDPLFSRLQYSTRTGDVFNPVRHWGVSFQYGSMFRVGVNEEDFVRPVTVYIPK